MTKQEKQFVDTVLAWHAEFGRHDLPWRKTKNPYHILVSELMLQQTQVSRVVPKYVEFIDQYPTVDSLAKATLGDVLRLWQGLGYNRRAKYLYECAQAVVSKFNGKFPNSTVELEKLPGIGVYTASAVCVFAYNSPEVLVETNVRQVMIHHFYKNYTEVTEADIVNRVTRTLPIENARVWYAALMDYGAYLKTKNGNNTRVLTNFTKQTAFKGSNRHVRGAILRVLANGPVKDNELRDKLIMQDGIEVNRIKEPLKKLVTEGLIKKNKQVYQLPD